MPCQLWVAQICCARLGTARPPSALPQKALGWLWCRGHPAVSLSCLTPSNIPGFDVHRQLYFLSPFSLQSSSCSSQRISKKENSCPSQNNDRVLFLDVLGGPESLASIQLDISLSYVMPVSGNEERWPAAATAALG